VAHETAITPEHGLGNLIARLELLFGGTFTEARDGDLVRIEALDGAANGLLQHHIHGRFTELDPALHGGFILHGIRQGHIITGADPAIGVDVIEVIAAIGQPR